MKQRYVLKNFLFRFFIEKVILRVYYLEEPSLIIKAIGIRLSNKIEVFKGLNSVDIVRKLCKKLNSINAVRLVVYDDKELFPLKILILKNEIFCRGLSELDNKLNKIVIKERFNNVSLEKLAKFFGYSLCDTIKIKDLVFSNDLNSLEFCIKKDLEFLSEIYKKLEENFL